ncbi:PREDICTED: uncharacterized protein LOC101299556 [Fragaria vesca subsp. vesca]|uniref:uncharacterized protein LOC101299556 n=1 Tax=Fragaria vesca subsp. vesca TaxID=101020 RepID=UPI0002C3746E|nr:PREDICTED: uncharacterized protein LOC101299556 [Fragaria vesca subsp. vesca]
MTIMVLKVDLQCEKCYKKVKKVLCKFPQIRDQTYEEKNNQVIIKVVCCSPEKIRDKLCCKGGGAIKSIDIKEPKPKVEKPPVAENQKPEEKPKPSAPPFPAYPPVTVSACCIVCYGGHPGGPCQTGYGYGGAAPYIEYDGYYGRPVYDSYGGGRSYATSSCCVTRPDCFSEENPQVCAIM